MLSIHPGCSTEVRCRAGRAVVEKRPWNPSVSVGEYLAGAAPRDSLRCAVTDWALEEKRASAAFGGFRLMREELLPDGALSAKTDREVVVLEK